MIETPLRYCVLCRDVAASLTTQEPILYHLIVAIRARQLPARHPLAVVTHWVLDGPATHRVYVSVYLPASKGGGDRETLIWSESEMSVQAPDTHYIHTFQFGELDFPAAGLYRVEVDLDGRPAGAFPLLVIQQVQIGQIGIEQAAPVEGTEQDPGESDEQV